MALDVLGLCLSPSSSPCVFPGDKERLCDPQVLGSGSPRESTIASPETRGELGRSGVTVILIDKKNCFISKGCQVLPTHFITAPLWPSPERWASLPRCCSYFALRHWGPSSPSILETSTGFHTGVVPASLGKCLLTVKLALSISTNTY